MEGKNTRGIWNLHMGAVWHIKTTDLISHRDAIIEANDILINDIGSHYLIKCLTLLACYFTLENIFYLTNTILTTLKEGQC